MSVLLEETIFHPNVTGKEIDAAVSMAISENRFGICVPPFWVKRAKREIGLRELQLITMVGYPLGFQMTETKCDELIRAIDNGANEVDIAMNLSSFKSNMPWTKIEFAKCALLAHERKIPVKFIFNQEFLSLDELITCSKMASDAGIDYVCIDFTHDPNVQNPDIINAVRKSLSPQCGLKILISYYNPDDADLFQDLGVERVGIRMNSNEFLASMTNTH